MCARVCTCMYVCDVSIYNMIYILLIDCAENILKFCFNKNFVLCSKEEIKALRNDEISYYDIRLSLSYYFIINFSMLYPE